MERPIANQGLHNQDQLKAVQSLSLFSLFPEDEKMKDNITLRVINNYRMGDVLSLGQDTQIQFES